jgi:hypothetical protein
MKPGQFLPWFDTFIAEPHQEILLCFDTALFEEEKWKRRVTGRGRSDYSNTRAPRSRILSHHQGGHPEFFRIGHFWVSAWKQLPLFGKRTWRQAQQITPLSAEQAPPLVADSDLLSLTAGSLKPAKRIKEKVNV